MVWYTIRFHCLELTYIAITHLMFLALSVIQVGNYLDSFCQRVIVYIIGACITGSNNKKKLRGNHIHTTIAFWFLFATLLKTFSHDLHRSGKMFVFINASLAEMYLNVCQRVFFSTDEEGLNVPFCSDQSPTCHMTILYDTPIHILQWV